MWFIAGLGNPGKKYINTRHNIGFDIFDLLIDKYDFVLNKKDKSKEIFIGSVNQTKCIFCKPLTYMNLVGPVISDIIKFYKITKSNILIIHDDIDLKVGKVKIKIGGGNGGHKGLLSIDNAMGPKYKRLRIGVDRPEIKDQVPSFVLEKFDKNDKKIIDDLVNIIINNFSLIFEKESLLLTKISSGIK
tara:strand:+ start:5642 stop:6205 length:564 start_codon:yes stop_codon:yes gene_type:complete